MKKKKNIWYGMRIYNILSFDKVIVIEEDKERIQAKHKDGSTQWITKKSKEHIYTKSRIKTATYIHELLKGITRIKKKVYLMNKEQQEEFEKLHKKWLIPHKEKKIVKPKNRRKL